MTRMWIAATGHPTEEWLNQNGRWYAPVDEDIEPHEVTPIPTPIDPADIRPGDVVRVTQEFEVENRGTSGTLHGCGGEEFRPMAASQLTWHLIHRPDPDAEAIEALGRWLHDAMSACQDPYGTCITTTEYFREKAKAIIEFQRRAES